MLALVRMFLDQQPVNLGGRQEVTTGHGLRHGERGAARVRRRRALNVERGVKAWPSCHGAGSESLAAARERPSAYRRR